MQPAMCSTIMESCEEWSQWASIIYKKESRARKHIKMQDDDSLANISRTNAYIHDQVLPHLTAACANDGAFGAADRVEMGEDAGAVV
jgi:hypothetical protein